MQKLKWGVLSTANIGREKVIPALQKSELGEVVAIASANASLAAEIAAQHQIPIIHSAYQDLLNDERVEAVYIPLPNHLHVEWSIKALQAGKHVLCEKPIGLSVTDTEKLVNESAKYPHLKVMEAFMYRFHPQWQQARQWVKEGLIGELKTIQSFFSFYNDDPANIRNKPEMGGGGLMDIGCYSISLSRFIFGKEPMSVFGMLDIDPRMNIDRMASGLMNFGNGTSAFTCSMQANNYQQAHIIGTKGAIKFDIPFSPSPDKAALCWLHSGNTIKEVYFDKADQFTLQGDAFAAAVLKNEPVPTPLKDALNNMRCIEAVMASAKMGQWINL
jgi:predicted dehydrogenase